MPNPPQGVSTKDVGNESSDILNTYEYGLMAMLLKDGEEFNKNLLTQMNTFSSKPEFNNVVVDKIYNILKTNGTSQEINDALSAVNLENMNLPSLADQITNIQNKQKEYKDKAYLQNLIVHFYDLFNKVYVLRKQGNYVPSGNNYNKVDFVKKNNSSKPFLSDIKFAQIMMNLDNTSNPPYPNNNTKSLFTAPAAGGAKKSNKSKLIYKKKIKKVKKNKKSLK